jgi:hypothetical protein
MAAYTVLGTSLGYKAVIVYPECSEAEQMTKDIQQEDGTYRITLEQCL